MKYKFIQTSLLLLIINFVSYGQQSQEIKGGLNNALKEMTKALDDLDIEHLLNQEIFGKIDEIKPSKEQIHEIEDLMKISIESLNAIDLSGLAEVLEEIEMSIDKIDIDKILKGVNKVNSGREGKKI